jgi:hypothetical protein
MAINKQKANDVSAYDVMEYSTYGPVMVSPGNCVGHNSAPVFLFALTMHM